MSGIERQGEREDGFLRAALRAAGIVPAHPEASDRPRGCPDAETLAARHDGRLDPAEARAVDEHAEGCEHCRALVEFLAADPPREDEAAAENANRRNRIALAIAVAAVVAVILGGRLLLVGLGVFGSNRRVPASGGVVVAARGGAAVAGRAAAIAPGEFLAAGSTIDLGGGGEVVIATPDGFLALSGAGTRPAPGDCVAARISAGRIHGQGSTLEARLLEAKANTRRGAFDAPELLYPRDTILDPRPDVLLARPSAAELVVRVERADGDRAVVFEAAPAPLPRPFPPEAPDLAPGVEYRVRLLTADGAGVSSARFRVASPETRREADERISRAAEAAGPDPEGRGFARSLALLGLGYASDGLREGLGLARSSRASREFRLEMGIAAQALVIDSLVAEFFD